MKNSICKGTGVAMVTPFNAKHDIDYDALQKLIEFNIGHGINYLVSLGTTGETAVLSREEKTAVWKFTVKAVNKRVPVLIGLGGNDTSEMCRQLETIDMSGFDAVLSVSPYYNKPTQEGLFRHYMKLAEASSLPVMIYNVPGRTAMNVTAETTLRLAHASEKFIGVKEASGNFTQIMQIIKNKPKDFLVISGDDTITLPLLACGCDGVISVAANCFPEAFSAMVKLAIEGNFGEAKQLHYKLFTAMELLFSEGSPAGVKAALSIKNICSATVRLPNVEATESLKARLAVEISGNNI